MDITGLIVKILLKVRFLIILNMIVLIVIVAIRETDVVISRYSSFTNDKKYFYN